MAAVEVAMVGGGDKRGVLTIGGVLGMALMGALDEIVFHQLLQWHHFYMATGEFWRVHQVRVGADDLWLYDAGWIASALLLLLPGWILLRMSDQR